MIFFRRLYVQYNFLKTLKLYLSKYWHIATEKVAAKGLLPISIQTNKRGSNRRDNRECVGMRDWLYTVNSNRNSKIYVLKYIFTLFYSKLKLLVKFNGS